MKHTKPGLGACPRCSLAQAVMPSWFWPSCIKCWPPSAPSLCKPCFLLWHALLPTPLQDVSVVAVDLSPAALAHAAFNAARCGVAGHVQVKQGSWFEPLETLGLRGSLAGLLSNPPYIPAVQMQGLQAEVSVHEPWSALSGGDEAGMESLQVRTVR